MTNTSAVAVATGNSETEKQELVVGLHRFVFP